MKIKTKETIKDLAGKDVKFQDGVFTVGLPLSNILLDAKTGGKMKMLILAQKFYNDETVELDAADVALVKQAVEATEQYNNLVTGQLLQILDVKEK